MVERNIGPPKKDEKPTGLYAPLVDRYVRVSVHGETIIGKLVHTDYEKSYLQPHTVGVGTFLSSRVNKISDKPAIIDTKAIDFMLSTGTGEEYLDEIVRDTEEQSKRDQFLKEKDLRDKGYPGLKKEES